MNSSERPARSLCNENCPIINVAKSELRDSFLRELAANSETKPGLSLIERGLLSQIERLENGCDGAGPGYAQIETVGGHACPGVCRSSAMHDGEYLEAVVVKRTKTTN